MTKKSKSTLSLKLDKDKHTPSQLQEQLQSLKDALPKTTQPLISKKQASNKREEKTQEEKEKEKAKKAKQHAFAQKKLQQEGNRQRFQKMKKALNWLQDTYPDCFNLEAPKPLKIRIEKDIFDTIPEDLPFPRLAIRWALSYYTRSSKYKEVLSTASHRYDLGGNIAGEVIPFTSSSVEG